VLKNKLTHHFSQNSRFSGELYHQNGQVADLNVTQISLSSVVRGERPYSVIFDWKNSDGKVEVSCTCPFFGTGNWCKHVWATILASEEADLIPYTLNDPNVSFLHMGLHKTHPEGNRSANHPADLRPISTRAAAPRLHPWRFQLDRIGGGGDSESPSFNDNVNSPASTSATTTEIWYQLEFSGNGVEPQTLVRFHAKSSNKSGRLGGLKPLKLREEDIAQLPEGEDKELLKRLVGNSARQDSYDFGNRSDRFLGAVISQLCNNELLPRLCATGRFGISLKKEGPVTDLTPIQWEENTPWKFEIDFSEINNRWVAYGYFRRNDERRPVNEVDALFSSGLMLSHGKLSCVTFAKDLGWVEQLRRPDGFSVPISDIEPFIEKVHDIPYLPQITWPENFPWKVLHVVPQKQLSLSSKRGFKSTPHFLAHLSFKYGDSTAAFGKKTRGVVDKNSRTIYVRDWDFENAAQAEVLKLGAQIPQASLKLDSDLLVPTKAFIGAVRTLLAAGWKIESQKVAIRPLQEFKIEIVSGVDWFDLKIKGQLPSEKIGITQLLDAIKKDGSLIQLGDGTQGLLPEKWLEQYAAIAQLGEAHGDGLRFKKSQSVLLDALLQSHVENFKPDLQFQKTVEKIRESVQIRVPNEPKGFEGKLRRYQREGLGWLQYLHSMDLGGCLADDMGLGKTIQVLALLQALPSDLPSLIIVPKSLVFNWISEAAKFTPSLKVLEYTGSRRRELKPQWAEADLIVTTYGTIRTDITELSENQFFYVILDESQMIKNSSSQIGKAVRLLAAEHRLVLTGTPIENHIGELWSQLEFLNPGMLGGAAAFKRTTVDLDPVEGSSEKADWLSSLSDALKPFILRRTKEKVLKELPSKSEQILYCDFEKEEQELYEDLRDHYRSNLLGKVEENGLNKSKILILEALLRMRQAACHYGLVDKSRVHEESAKTRVLLSRLVEILQSGHKALIFSQFTSFLSIIKRLLDEQNIVYEYLDGSTIDRKERVDRFQNDDKCPVFLLSLKAGGVGLNLTAADYVFILDPWWNPAVEAQAIDRTHRIGQHKSVMVYRLITRNTVEEKVLELQKKKRALADTILSTDQSILRKISLEDLTTLMT
jgi:superfamily II DNA or RNA helicase